MNGLEEKEISLTMVSIDRATMINPIQTIWPAEEEEL